MKKIIKFCLKRYGFFDSCAVVATLGISFIFTAAVFATLFGGDFPWSFDIALKVLAVYFGMLISLLFILAEFHVSLHEIKIDKYSDKYYHEYKRFSAKKP